VYLLYWYKSAQCTCFTGTKVQILTHWKLQHNEEYMSPAILEALRRVESEEGPVEASLKVSLREAVQRTLDIWY
jgi:hypothetical protein